MCLILRKLNLILKINEQGLSEDEKDIALALIADICQIECQRYEGITGEPVLVEGFDAGRVTLP